VSALLETHDLTVSYGGLHANSNVNIKVQKGKLTGLIGPNGAGKTTFIDAITGFTNVSSGARNSAVKTLRVPRQPSALATGSFGRSSHLNCSKTSRCGTTSS